MSAAADLARFLASIGPELMSLGHAIFGATRGDASAAKRKLRAIAASLRVGRAGIDAAARRKFR